MNSARDLLDLDRPALAELLRAGHPVDPAALDDKEYRGISLGLPGWVDRLLWKTFRKVFHRDPETGLLRGWNVRCVQAGLEDGWRPQTRRGRPRTFGHYRVTSMEGHRPPRPVGDGLMLDYGPGGNRLLDPTRALRDPVVALEPGSADLLLGWSYLDLGLLRLPTPSYFVLERDGALTHRADPPRPVRG
ncbi:MAG: hypothetical protein ACQEXJ_09420 [Myxococcota bacterium]